MIRNIKKRLPINKASCGAAQSRGVGTSYEAGVAQPVPRSGRIPAGADKGITRLSIRHFQFSI